MRYHYVWLIWSSAFLLPWIALYLSNPLLRTVMWRASLATAVLGLTEPIFVPGYWNPPSLFDLVQRTGFDIESVIFSFAIGGVGVVLYNALTRTHLVPVPTEQRTTPLHRFHTIALLVPFAAFVPLALLPWNSIYPAITALVLGSTASVICRPRLAKKTLVCGALFLGFYAVFMLGLKWFAPGYIEQVWNLQALSGVLFGGIPLEELLFGTAFGLYWSGVYEHFAWTESVAQTR
ncbi:MAG: lycopene cyclase domain-containing protein [Gemmatimonadaceae bacterium]|nr:lycopene cyclase domain-containing protein [Gemmatimonadaceae bacterium]